MVPGFYVLRQTASAKSVKLESRCFNADHVDASPEERREHSMRYANNWRDYIASTHPKDHVVVVEVFAHEPDPVPPHGCR